MLISPQQKKDPHKPYYQRFKHLHEWKEASLPPAVANNDKTSPPVSPGDNRRPLHPPLGGEAPVVTFSVASVLGSGMVDAVVWARLETLKDGLQHPVLSILDDSGVKGDDSFASMVEFDRAKEALSVTRELKGLLSKVSPLPISTSSAHYSASHGNTRLGSSRNMSTFIQFSLRTCLPVSVLSDYKLNLYLLKTWLMLTFEIELL
ncbi:hypothetical protein Cgig2_018549 [Carnegiea gigantea]|uniref:Uncharacterized protein n=1 Tax=Carnegiea gigantea TaxID=171969 RepID=A0A9Q1KMQ0_9CARY|nr:hypothetical protein Cgig2_018549 [Carnegiea gigantea]